MENPEYNAVAVGRKKTGLEKIKLYKPKAMQQLAIIYIKSFFVQRVRRGIDGRGRRFKGYTEKYAEMKRGGFKKKDGSMMKRYSGVAISSNKTDVPDLTVRGTTLKAMQLFAFDRSGFTVGFDGQPASVISGQKDQGRNIIDSIPNKEEEWLRSKIEDLPNAQIRKLKSITIKVKIL